MEVWDETKYLKVVAYIAGIKKFSPSKHYNFFR
jgi:hypothetical protein